jgi:pimeloyl-ACP methyl ester carboxylesterase
LFSKSLTKTLISAFEIPCVNYLWRIVEMETAQKFSLPDGRQLGFSLVGEGKPVLYFHGTASSRLETLLLKEFACSYDFQVIGVDRPGYGLSTFAPRTRLRDFSADVNSLVAYLGLDKFGLLTWSGGGPFGLVYVALFPEHVSKAVIVSSPALPFDVATAHNGSIVRFAMKVPMLAMWGLKRFRAEVLKANKDIDAFLASKSGGKIVGSWPKADAKFLADPDWLRLMYGSMAEGFRQGNDGIKAVFQEHQLFIKPWADPITQIPSDKVCIWQGTEDTTCQVDNAYRLAKAVPNARIDIFEGEGHCVMFDNLQQLYKRLKSK